MAENKVMFNLCNVHYAVKTDAGYLTPVKVPGAVSLSLEAQGDEEKTYADGITYYVSYGNTGYTGSLEMVLFPAQMFKDIWKNEETEDKVLVEYSNKNAAEFALLFQIDGDKNNAYYVIYDVTASRPGIAAETTTGSKTPKTQSCNITAAPLADGKVRASTTHETTEQVKTDWFTKVYGQTMAPA